MKLKTGTTKSLTFAFITAYLVAASANDDAYARRHHDADQNSEAVYNQTSMEIFPIKRGYDGAQFVVTKEGYLVSLPGLGVAPDATQVAAYRDAQNNIWYIDRHGSPIKLTTQEIEWGRAQINQQAQERALSGQMQPPSTVVVQQPAPTVIVQQPNNQGSSGGAGALTTSLVAAGGAFAGAALGSAMYHNSYGGIPYGQPIYRNGGHYYYNGSNGNKVYINNSNNQYINQWNKQTNWQNTNHNHPPNWQNSNNNQRPQPPANSNWQKNKTEHPTQMPANPHGNNNTQRPTQLPAHGDSHQGRTRGNSQGGRYSFSSNLGAAQHSSRSFGGSSGRASGGASRAAEGANLTRHQNKSERRSPFSQMVIG